MNEAVKAATWIGDSREQVRRFPKVVKRIIGEALGFAQRGAKHPSETKTGEYTMNLPSLRLNLPLLFVVIVTLPLLAPSPGTGQDATCTLSGRVVDVAGNPVAGLPLLFNPRRLSTVMLLQ